MAGEAATGTPSPPMPARSGAWGIYETFPTLNGEKLFIGITSDNHWRSFCAKFARPDLLADERFTTNADRVRNRPALREIVAAIVRDVAIADLERIMDEANIPFSAVRTPSDLFDDPQLNAFGRALAVRMPKGNVAKLPGLPFCIDDEAPALRMQPPAAGEHTDAILRRWVIRRSELQSCGAARPSAERNSAQRHQGSCARASSEYPAVRAVIAAGFTRRTCEATEND